MRFVLIPVAFREPLAFWIFLLTRGRVHSSAAAYRLFELSLRQHNYQRAARICSVAANRYPHSSDVQSMRCTLAFKQGELHQGLELLDARLSQGDFRAVERLLFRTGSRPADLEQRFLVLERIAVHEKVLDSHRCYARIAQSYLVLKVDDRYRAADLLAPLHQLALGLDVDSELVTCQLSNRRNRAKLLVSLCTSGYHLALMLEADDELERFWRMAMDLLPRLAFDQLNPDAGLRMSSNLGRCLAIGWVLPTSLGSARHQSIAASLAALEQAVKTNCLPKDRRSGRGTQENHLVLMASLRSEIQALLTASPAEQVPACRRLARQLNHSSFRELTGLIEQRLLAALSHDR